MTDKTQLQADPSSELTGLPWPKTWRGIYIFVLCNFVFWLVLLTVLTGLK